MCPLKGSEYTLTACAKTILLDSEVGLRLMEMLGGTTWARGMSHDEVKGLIAYLHMYDFKKGEGIFTEGDQECYMGMVMAGNVEISKHGEERPGNEKQLAVLGPGQVFGEMAMLDGQPRSASAIARDEVLLAVLLDGQYRKLCAENAPLALKLTGNIARCVSLRLRRTSDSLVHYL